MKKSFKIISLLLIFTMTFGILTGCGKNGKSEGSMSYKDGVYEGIGTGNGGQIRLNLTIEGGKIASIDVLEHKETEVLSDAAFEKIPQAVVDNQSVNIDGVTGATYTSSGLILAIKDALKKAGGNEEIFNKGEKINLAEKEEELEQTYDVVVIGGGGAGLSAAVEAQSSGAKVVLLEKMSSLGGNTLVSGGGLNVPGTKQQKALGIEDSVELFIEDTMNGGDNINKKELVTVIAKNALPTTEWLVNEINVEFMPDRLQQFGGHSVPRALISKNNHGTELIRKLKAYGDKLGVEFKMETRAEELIMDNNRVVGVKAKNAAGQEIIFNANRGVIIATGGFGANKEMRVKYDPDKDDKYKTTDVSGTTGDGIIMAEKLGADLMHMEYIQTYPTCNPKTGIISYVANSRFDGAVLLNQEGKRFVEEMDRRDIISKAILEQTNNEAYLIWGQEIEEVGNMTKVHEDEYKVFEKMDLIYKADTLEELAKHFEVDKDNLLASIEKYNRFVENGKDEDFNRRGKLRIIEKGPFYIQKVAPAIHHTMGGIVINEDAKVLDNKGKVIEGLFAAGEVTGGIHGTNRLGGNAVTDVIVFGRIAGQKVVE
ncbi:flavocytochrome c [Tissierella praeacuta]|uniref:flavocytochrome c n=1 Tax=Tissierella praeacuta TaxID=43131 RepID=UPI003DA2BEB2